MVIWQAMKRSEIPAFENKKVYDCIFLNHFFAEKGWKKKNFVILQPV
jgi:hypothetical protein